MNLLLRLQIYRNVASSALFISVCLSFVFPLFLFDICSADTVYLKGTDSAISLKVNKVTERYIVATIRKEYVDNINIRPDRSKMFPDAIYFTSNPRNRIRCNIIDIANDIYMIKLSMNDIESLDINPKSNNDRNNITFPENRDTNNNRLRASRPYGGDLSDLELVEDMEFYDIYTENQAAEPNALTKRPLPGDFFNNNSPRPENSNNNLDAETLKEQIKKELLDAMNKQKDVEEKQFLLENTGKVTGKIFRNGQPYPNCKVKIVALTKERILFFKSVKRGEHLETVTDENGMYYFRDVEPGNYKLFWKPHYEKSWIRRFDMKPDVFVTAGKTSFPKTLEINKRVIK